MLVYQTVWNDGEIYNFPFDRYSLQEMRELRDEITLSTHGALTARINLVEVEHI